MRIALVWGSPPKKLGSLEQWLMGTLRALRARGHAVDLYTPLEIHPVVQRELSALEVPVSSFELFQATPFTASRRMASYDLIELNLVTPRSRVALCCYGGWPAKVVFVQHNGADSAQAVRPGRRLVSRTLDRLTLLRVEELVGVSEFIRRRDAQRFRPTLRRSRVIYNGVDLARFTSVKGGAASGDLRLICVAQLIPEKGIDVLLRAMTQLQASCRLQIVGYGRLEAALKALVAELGLEPRVQFLGMRDDVHLLLREADVLIQPTVCDEAFGLTIAEGMASGCAVVATRGGGVPEIIDDGVDGILVSKGDAAAIARAVDGLAVDSELRQRLSQAARAKIERKFTLSRCIQEHVDCMEGAVLGRIAAESPWALDAGEPCPVRQETAVGG